MEVSAGISKENKDREIENLLSLLKSYINQLFENNTVKITFTCIKDKDGVFYRIIKN